MVVSVLSLWDLTIWYTKLSFPEPPLPVPRPPPTRPILPPAPRLEDGLLLAMLTRPGLVAKPLPWCVGRRGSFSGWSSSTTLSLVESNNLFGGGDVNQSGQREQREQTGWSLATLSLPRACLGRCLTNEHTVLRFENDRRLLVQTTQTEGKQTYVSPPRA